MKGLRRNANSNTGRPYIETKLPLKLQSGLATSGGV